MACGCGSRRTATVYVLTYEDGSGRTGGEFQSREDARVADARNGGGGVIRPVRK